MPRAIVTGASSGIGHATARALARRGFDVGITYQRNAEAAERVAAELRALGADVAVRRLDLAAPASAGEVIASLAHELGGLDALVNNAGANRRATVLDETVEGFQAALSVNLVGAWACAQAGAARMIADATAGRIVNVTSILASEPLTAGGAYCAAKAGLEALTKVMALEWAQHGILVNAVAPGHTATPLNYSEEELGPGETLARPVIPLGRAADAGEIADAIAFFATTGSYVTGASLMVDGGLRLASGPEALQDATRLPPVREPLP